MKFEHQFGAKPTKEDQLRYAQSENWKNGKFQNFKPTKVLENFWDIGPILYQQLTNREKREPKAPLPIIPFNKESFLAPSEETKIIWYGHSVVLMNMMGKTILIDPMLGSNAAPISPKPVKRFSDNSLELIDDFPDLDIVLMSHDHYDHLDYDSIQKLIPKTKQFFVALGVKRHLVKWGVSEDKIQEFDWWDSQNIEGIDITFTPTQHMSGRGLTDRCKSLWGGWVFKSRKDNIWFSGDGGYGTHFKEIGEKLGPFDFAFMECGQYNEKWPAIHSLPFQSIQALKDAKANKGMPVHWAGFSLAMHSWTEPAKEFTKFAKEENLEISLPKLGQLFTIEEDLSDNKWWI